MTLIENVVMIVVLVIAVLMFYNVVIFVTNVNTDVMGMVTLQGIVKEIEEEIDQLHEKPVNFEVDLEGYLQTKEEEKKIIVGYTLHSNGVYLEIEDKNKNNKINIFKTLGVVDER